MRLLAAVLLVLMAWSTVGAQSMTLGVGAVSARPGFTLHEKAQARKGFDAHAQMIAAFRSLATAVSVSTGEPAKAALAAVWDFVHYEVREIGHGNLLLIGINDGQNTLDSIAAREAIPRATWVTDAFAHHDAALGNMSSAQAAVTAALAVGGQPAAYTTALNAIAVNFTTAQGLIAGIDRTQSYLKARFLPYCPDPENAATLTNNSVKNGACNVIGPHGNWIMATQEVQMGWTEITLSLSTAGFGPRMIWTANGGAEPALPDSINPVIADILVSQAELLNNLMTIMYNFAVIPVSAVQCTFTPFHLVSRTIERFLQFGDTTDSITSPANGGPIAGNPFYFNMRGNFESNLNALVAAFGTTHPQTHDVLDRFISTLLVTWRFTEGGFWDSFAMPTDIYNIIIGNANSGGPPFGETVFPYYFGVTSARDLRVYVRNVASATNKVPLVEGSNSTSWGGTVTMTITGVGNPAGGTVVFSVPPPNDFHVMIERVWGTRLEAQRARPYVHNDPVVGTVGPCN